MNGQDGFSEILSQETRRPRLRVVVAGATGAVGSLPVPMLVAAGHEVTGTSRTLAGIERIRSLGATGFQADALDADGAANGRIRREGTRNLVEAAKAAGVGRIVAQSISWAYAPSEGPAEEVVPLDRTAAQPRARMVAAVRALEETAAELETAVLLRSRQAPHWPRSTGQADRSTSWTTSPPPPTTGFRPWPKPSACPHPARWRAG
ncbi:NAD-dependent epimerase/dehydratase family protein [Streptomyces sp. YKOK-I1]